MITLYNNLYLSDAVHHVGPVIKSLDVLECAGVAILCGILSKNRLVLVWHKKNSDRIFL